MRTIALVNQKGGVGKTTVALHLATGFQDAGRSVIVLDLDPQASAAQWKDARGGTLPHVYSIQPARLKVTAKEAADLGTDILILDTAPHSEATIMDTLRMADLVLIPCQPSIMDLRAMGTTIDLVKLVGKNAFAVINGVQHHSLTAAREAEKTIEKHLGLPVAPVRIGERVAYSRCLITGQTAQEIEPAGKAANEVKKLHKWVAAQLESEKVPA